MNPAIIKGILAQIELLREQLGDHDADEILRADMLEAETDMDGLLRHVVKAYRVAQFDEAGARAAKAEAEARYATRITSAERRQDAAKSIMTLLMTEAGLRSRKLPEATISITDGKQSLHLAEDFTPPQGYQRVKVEPDKKAILEALQRGDEIPGANIVIGQKIVSVR